MASAIFITGTDTDVGKTLVSAALLHKCKQFSYSSAAIKPVAAGCEQTTQGLRNTDALLLQKFCSLSLSYTEVNPVALTTAIAPHIAAAEQGSKLSVAQLQKPVQQVLDKHAQLTLIEGAGGWLVPLNQKETLADLAIAFKLPVILVVSIRLGCINHALLTARAIEADGLNLIAWVANLNQGETARFQENIQTLKERIKAPLLATIPVLAPASPLVSSQSSEEAKIIAASQYIDDDSFQKMLTMSRCNK